jgi:hypothetical protein
MVYFFKREGSALYFKELLENKGLWYEHHFDEEDSKHYFAIKRTDEQLARNLNLLAIGKHRPNMISNPILKYTLIIVCFGILVLAIIGFFQAQ